jgi:hypothetical protein
MSVQNIAAIDSLFLWLRTKAFFYRFTWFTRILLSAGFLAPGMVKLLGERFTQIEVDNPIGFFFEAMYRTGFYWRFLGAAQVAAALLLLIPAWTHLGAAMFLPIILNICLITWSMHFGGTPVVTTLMLLAVTYLVFYDWHRFRSILFTTTEPHLARLPVFHFDNLERLGFIVFAISILNIFWVARFQAPLPIGAMAITGFLGGLLALLRFLLGPQNIRQPITPESP